MQPDLKLVLEAGLGLRVGAPVVKDSNRLSRFCCTFGEVNLFQQAFHWVDLEEVLVWVWVPPVGHVGAVDPILTQKKRLYL